MEVTSVQGQFAVAHPRKRGTRGLEGQRTKGKKRKKRRKDQNGGWGGQNIKKKLPMFVFGSAVGWKIKCEPPMTNSRGRHWQFAHKVDCNPLILNRRSCCLWTPVKPSTESNNSRTQPKRGELLH